MLLLGMCFSIVAVFSLLKRDRDDMFLLSVVFLCSITSLCNVFFCSLASVSTIERSWRINAKRLIGGNDYSVEGPPPCSIILSIASEGP